MARCVASRWITDSCAVVHIMLGREMGRFLFGVFVGSTLCLFVFSLVADSALKESVRNGWMVIDGVPYEINKSNWADVVEVKSKN